jgi:hypothetical protein
MADTIGIAYPFRVDDATGRVVLSEGNNHIKEAVHRIIQYSKYDLIGEDIGSGARDRIFDVKSGLMISDLIADVKYAIEKGILEIEDVFVTLVKTEEQQGIGTEPHFIIAVKYSIKEGGEEDSTQVLL